MSDYHVVTLWSEDRDSQLIGHAHLLAYPLVGDVVRDADGNDWVVTGRRHHHEGGLVLICK